jgi:hypothetical protein
VGRCAPPARHSFSSSFNVVHLLVSGFTNANRPARRLRGRGEWNRSLRSSGGAPTRRPRDLPRCNVRDPDRIAGFPSPRHRPSRRPLQSRSTGAPRPRHDGRNGPARHPTAGPGSGCWRDSGVGAFESVYPVRGSGPACVRRCRKTKNRASDVCSERDALLGGSRPAAARMEPE